MGMDKKILFILRVMELHIYHAILEVMTVPQINQLFLFDNLFVGCVISDKILIAETPRGSYFVAFSQAFIQFEYWLNILIHTKIIRC
jgi:hypothetical protein